MLNNILQTIDKNIYNQPVNNINQLTDDIIKYIIHNNILAEYKIKYNIPPNDNNNRKDKVTDTDTVSCTLCYTRPIQQYNSLHTNKFFILQPKQYELLDLNTGDLYYMNTVQLLNGGRSNKKQKIDINVSTKDKTIHNDNVQYNIVEQRIQCLQNEYNKKLSMKNKLEKDMKNKPTNVQVCKHHMNVKIEICTVIIGYTD